MLTVSHRELAPCHGKLLSLRDMLEYTGARLSILLAQLRELEQLLKPVRSANLGGPGAEAAIRELLIGIAQECEKLSLPTSFAQILRERLDNGALPAALASSFNLLHETIERDLEKSLSLLLSPDEAEQYREPTASFPKTMSAFPKAASDITAARRCFLLGQDTACVFHCMGILQYGLYSLASNLEVEFPWSIELENWQTVIERIEAAIKKKRGDLRKGDERDDQLKFYSGLATRFTYFKDAWRNHVCHLRETYDHDEAFTVLLHTKDFMELLSSRLKEMPT